MSEKYDVVIVGGGMVGASLACSLSSAKCSVLLIEAAPKDAFLHSLGGAESVRGFESRVSALTLKTQRFLAELGVWEKVDLKRVCFYQHMEVWDEQGTGRIAFDASEIHAQQLGCITENQQLVLALHEELANCDNVEVRYGTALASFAVVKESELGAQVQLKLTQGEHCEAKLLVGADGVNSRVRALANLPTREWDYGHSAIVTTVEMERPHGNTARQRFSESGPVAFLPLNDADSSHRFCSIVWSIESDQADILMSLSDEAFSERLGAQIEHELGAVQQIGPRYSFPLRQRHAKEYVAGGLALIGDAAHSIHPLAGQGVNLGFADVKELSKQIKTALRDKLSPSHPFLLRKYQRTRVGDNLVMMGAMEAFKQLFEQQDPGIRWLRNTGLNFVNQQPFLKNKIAARAMGLDA